MKKSRPFLIENGRLFVALPLWGVRMGRDGASVLVERLSLLVGRLTILWKLLLSGKLQNDVISLSAMPINRRCGLLFEKVSPRSDYNSSAVR